MQIFVDEDKVSLALAKHVMGKVIARAGGIKVDREGINLVVDTVDKTIERSVAAGDHQLVFPAQGVHQGAQILRHGHLAAGHVLCRKLVAQSGDALLGVMIVGVAVIQNGNHNLYSFPQGRPGASVCGEPLFMSPVGFCQLCIT